uniref:Uncharacterized protein n=1 Tax=Lactuca sativa TaxID=4236 RepID=A0A9R1VF07_LACSA|nr:hypothetical protein LSAT_V11C500268780 [Lactuca sativa]
MVWKRLDKCAFLNPYKIFGKACQETPIDVVNYLVDAITHWVLLVICPSNHIVYILDSLMKPIQNPVDNYYLLKLAQISTSGNRYEKNTSIPIVWKLTEVIYIITFPLVRLQPSRRIGTCIEWALCNKLDL